MNTCSEKFDKLAMLIEFFIQTSMAFVILILLFNPSFQSTHNEHGNPVFSRNTISAGNENEMKTFIALRFEEAQTDVILSFNLSCYIRKEKVLIVVNLQPPFYLGRLAQATTLSARTRKYEHKYLITN